jgi:hypothetical protein
MPVTPVPTLIVHSRERRHGFDVPAIDRTHWRDQPAAQVQSPLIPQQSKAKPAPEIGGGYQTRNTVAIVQHRPADTDQYLISY